MGVLRFGLISDESKSDPLKLIGPIWVPATRTRTRPSSPPILVRTRHVLFFERLAGARIVHRPVLSSRTRTRAIFRVFEHCLG